MTQTPESFKRKIVEFSTYYLTFKTLMLKENPYYYSNEELIKLFDIFMTTNKYEEIK